MATIPLINGTPDTLDLSYGSDMSQDYRVRRVDFGDGYSQRSKRGINNAPQQWRLIWNGISDTDAEMLRVFFAGLGGVGVIEWEPYNQATELKWTANGWAAAFAGFETQDCSITLTQEFDL